MRYALLVLLILAGCHKAQAPVVVPQQPAAYPLGRDMVTSIGIGNRISVSLTCKVVPDNGVYIYTYRIQRSGESTEACFFNWAVLDKVMMGAGPFFEGGTCLLELKPGADLTYELRSKEYPTELRSGSLLMRVFSRANAEDYDLHLLSNKDCTFWPCVSTTAFGPIPPTMVENKKKVK